MKVAERAASTTRKTCSVSGKMRVHKITDEGDKARNADAHCATPEPILR